MSVTFFVILPYAHAHLVAADELERTLNLMLHRRNINHCSRSYFDEFAEYGTEYGVRIDLEVISGSQFEGPFNDANVQRLLGEIVSVCAMLYGSIQIQLGE